MARPCEEGGALRDHPVQAAVEVEYCHGGCGRGRGQEGGERCGGGDPLVEEGNAQRYAGKRGEEGEGGDGLVSSVSGDTRRWREKNEYILCFTGHSDQTPPSCVEILRWR
jgi:hypothetical protein